MPSGLPWGCTPPFEHSLGVHWLADKAIDIIKKYQVNILFKLPSSYVDAAYDLQDYTAHKSCHPFRVQRLVLNVLMY